MAGEISSELQQASFSPTGDHILTSFFDGTILIWKTDTFQMQWKIRLENYLAKFGSLDWKDLRTITNLYRTTSFACSANGEVFAYGGL